MSKVPILDVFLAMDWFTFVHAACDIPLRLATRSEKLVGRAAEVLEAATFFQVYLFPVFKHLTATPFTVDVAFGCLQVAPIFVAACAAVIEIKVRVSARQEADKNATNFLLAVIMFVKFLLFLKV
jgi:hypothetical protein